LAFIQYGTFGSGTGAGRGCQVSNVGPFGQHRTPRHRLCRLSSGGLAITRKSANACCVGHAIVGGTGARHFLDKRSDLASFQLRQKSLLVSSRFDHHLRSQFDGAGERLPIRVLEHHRARAGPRSSTTDRDAGGNRALRMRCGKGWPAEDGRAVLGPTPASTGRWRS